MSNHSCTDLHVEMSKVFFFFYSVIAFIIVCVSGFPKVFMQ